jgi:hypothetical protein
VTRTAKLTLTDEFFRNEHDGRMFERRVAELLKGASADPSEVVDLALQVKRMSEGAPHWGLMEPEEFERMAVRLAQLVLELLGVVVEAAPPPAPAGAAVLTQGPQVTARLRPLFSLLWAERTPEGFAVQLFDGWDADYPPEKILRGLGRRLAQRAFEGWMPEFAPGEFAALRWPG